MVFVTETGAAAPCFVPHLPQYEVPSGLSKPQFGQIMPRSLRLWAEEYHRPEGESNKALLIKSPLTPLCQRGEQRENFAKEGN
ncbi:MAG: hypothetical protein A2028_01620 [Candidatus Aminicenantes bacterium RBG_19FT_COMBO_59_29]|nr:MAG: hypothetical protein A2028_01620 [Candidatus Aminicenantes bacterium RBG_19FT_COMBO_59_29]